MSLPRIQKKWETPKGCNIIETKRQQFKKQGVVLMQHGTEKTENFYWIWYEQFWEQGRKSRERVEE